MKPQRSHKSCWTCKSRRRKCDRAHPTCRSCDQRGIVCEGYEVRLRWGSGIASRGAFTGAEKPVRESVVPKEKGRRRDRERCQRVLSGQLDGPSGSTARIQGLGRDEDDESVFGEFFSTGIDILCAVNDSACLLRQQLPGLCQKSEALYRICLALQVLITPSRSDQFFEYFDTALKRFRLELDQNAAELADGTFTAGLLLCTIGVMHGTPWTMHLQGLYNVLLVNGLAPTHQQPTPYQAHLLEVMGVMDLPTFTIGRQRPHFGIWRHYCRNRGEPDAVEIVSGLPKSLLDLLSCIDEEVTEEDFWDWPGMRGTLVQYQLWEAYRLAGALTVRFRYLLLPARVSSQYATRREQLQKLSPPTEVVVSRIVSHIDAICRASIGTEGQNSLVLNSVQYPVLIAGLQSEVINGDAELKSVIKTCLSMNVRRKESNRLLYAILEEWWRCEEPRSVHELAESRGAELGLF
ncbi:Zn(II)2Cys6 transcription factor [Aspergillus lucknowensis]|uniref:Zn(2)-C6 fungal-type domain-containing protein n=1 Tax=Aspergillus lucknowensis TaxID=176173 RepID=A0ABR4LRS0_9EURO